MVTLFQDFKCGDKYDCYVVDSSGYVVLSAPLNVNQVGQFFGTINLENQLILKYFLEESIFDHVEVFNYQALCPLSILKPPSGAWRFDTVRK